MDGLKKRLNESIRLKLSIALAVAIFLVAGIAGVFSFVSAFEEVHELQDDVLRQIAALMDRQHLSPDPRGNEGRAKDQNEESRVIVQTLGGVDPLSAGVSVGVDAGGVLPLSASLPDGLQTLTADGESFRVLVRTMTSGERIAVAQETGFRNEIARDSALRTVMPILILVPILLLIVADLVRKMFLPIAALSCEIDQRAEQELHPLQEGPLPAEIRTFVVAINRLLARVAQSMEAQRRFVADAAHELRSPLTALSLQAERLAEAEMSVSALERLAVLRKGIGRGRSLLDQLLALAQAQSIAERPESTVSVQGIFRRVLEDLMPMAEAKHIDIGIDGAQDAQVRVSELDMIAMVRNLADNAIRYTSDGGRVDLSVGTFQGHAVLRVRDTGPGIPPAERERIFDPFYRSLGSDQIGSGLGLSIVKTVADRIQAKVQLAFSDEAKQQGLTVTVLIPLA